MSPDIHLFPTPGKCGCSGFHSSYTCGCGNPYSSHHMLVETKDERLARGHPVGQDVPYQAMGGLTGFSSLMDGYMRLDPSGIGICVFTSTEYYLLYFLKTMIDIYRYIDLQNHDDVGLDSHTRRLGYLFYLMYINIYLSGLTFTCFL